MPHDFSWKRTPPRVQEYFVELLGSKKAKALTTASMDCHRWTFWTHGEINSRRCIAFNRLYPGDRGMGIYIHSNLRSFDGTPREERNI